MISYIILRQPSEIRPVVTWPARSYGSTAARNGGPLLLPRGITGRSSSSLVRATRQFVVGYDGQFTRDLPLRRSSPGGLHIPYARCVRPPTHTHDCLFIE